MTSRIDELLKDQGWMIHDLVDGDQISNQEETSLIVKVERAEQEWKKVRDWLKKAYEWFETNDSISGNSVAYKELEEIIQEIQ